MGLKKLQHNGDLTTKYSICSKQINCGWDIVVNWPLWSLDRALIEMLIKLALPKTECCKHQLPKEETWEPRSQVSCMGGDDDRVGRLSEDSFEVKTENNKYSLWLYVDC